MKQNTLFITLAVVALILLVGYGVAPTQESAVGVVEAASPTTRIVKTEPVLITATGHAPTVAQASLIQGQSVVGHYEAQPLPNGEVVVRLESNACRVSSMIVSAGDIQGLWQASLTQGHSVAGLYEIQPLPNDEVAIKLKRAYLEEGLTCQKLSL